MTLWQLPPSLMAQGNDDALLSFVCDQLEDPKAFLADATRLLASLDVTKALNAVARLAVPYLGEHCAVDLLNDGTLERVVSIGSAAREDRRLARFVEELIVVGRTILVVDDDEDVRNMLCLALSAEGYAATGAADGLEALRQIRQGEPPALIVVDLMMPRMDGGALINAMAADASLAQVPVAIISGQTTSVEESAGPQVIARMVKPVELNDLLSVVHQFASRSGEQRPEARH